ncbi:MAG: hypothetical protein ACE3K2_04315 [Paenibacillus sp.]|uniref:hypothetical protein n=1 Tax=Paenibacillus sp. TaxID=58172 RepID=UPI003B7F178E
MMRNMEGTSIVSPDSYVMNTTQYATISLSISRQNPIKNDKGFEQTQLFFYILGQLRKQQLAQKYGGLFGQAFMYSTGVYFGGRNHVWGLRIPDARYLDLGEELIGRLLAELLSLDADCSPSEEVRLWEQARGNLIQRVERIFNDPFLYAASRYLEYVTGATESGTGVQGSYEIYSALSYVEWSEHKRTAMHNMQQFRTNITLLGDLSQADAETVSQLSQDDHRTEQMSGYINKQFQTPSVPAAQEWKESTKLIQNQTIIIGGFRCNNKHGFKDHIYAKMLDGWMGKYGDPYLLQTLRSAPVSAYHAGSRYDMMTGIWLISACVRSGMERNAAKIIKHCLEQQVLTSSRLETIKKGLIEELMFILDKPEGRMAYGPIMRTYNIQVSDIFHLVNEVTSAQLQRFVDKQVQFGGVYWLKGGR